MSYNERDDRPMDNRPTGFKGQQIKDMETPWLIKYCDLIELNSSKDTGFSSCRDENAVKSEMFIIKCIKSIFD